MQPSEALIESVNSINDTRRDMEDELRDRSEVYRTLVEGMAEIYGEGEGGALDQTQRILVALGMALMSGGQSQVEWTVTRALNHGASPEAVREVADIALLNGGTFAIANARFAYQALHVRQVSAARSKPHFGFQRDIAE
jgi:alkylhydroperoxidase/carboxymuconolactone decarboxylase family protein YurZ